MADHGDGLVVVHLLTPLAAQHQISDELDIILLNQLDGIHHLPQGLVFLVRGQDFVGKPLDPELEIADIHPLHQGQLGRGDPVDPAIDGKVVVRRNPVALQQLHPPAQ